MTTVPLVINGQIIQEQVLNDELLRVSRGLEMDSPQAGGLDPEYVRSVAVRNVVTRTLLCQAATTEGLGVTDAEAEAERVRRWGSRNNMVCGAGVRDAIVEDLLIERMSAVLTRHVQRPSRAETEAFYRRHRQVYLLREAVHAAHIVRNVVCAAEEADARELLSQAEAELFRGVAFGKVADRYSDCKGVVGSLGWVARGEMVPEFEEVVFALPTGGRSGIFRTVFGLHIAMVLKKRAEGYRPFEEVRPEIAARILGERRREVLAQAVSAMERASQIQFIHESTHA